MSGEFFKVSREFLDTCASPEDIGAIYNWYSQCVRNAINFIVKGFGAKKMGLTGLPEVDPICNGKGVSNSATRFITWKNQFLTVGQSINVITKMDF